MKCDSESTIPALSYPSPSGSATRLSPRTSPLPRWARPRTVAAWPPPPSWRPPICPFRFVTSLTRPLFRESAEIPPLSGFILKRQEILKFQGDQGGQRLGFVDFNLVFPVCLILLGQGKLGRNGIAVGQDWETSRIKYLFSDTPYTFTDKKKSWISRLVFQDSQILAAAAVVELTAAKGVGPVQGCPTEL